jgi:RNA polymerase sigma-70 factor (ECF subfamily)
MDHFRKQGVERSHMAADPSTMDFNPVTPDLVAAQHEMSRVVHQAIRSLPTDQRAVIILRELEGLSYKEISQIIGSSMGTVMSRLFYARKRLRELLKSYFRGEGHE